MNIQKLVQVFESHKAPALFENSKMQADFWDNEHISNMMLKAHLNPNWDAASRKPETIDATCRWLQTTLEYQPGDRLLDLGCGPGLYTTRFQEQGLSVTGIDFSKRSLNYAKEQATKHQQSIEYHYMNYLEMDYHVAFDLITLIYCDFGVLSELGRSQLLSKIHRGLKTGGHFAFDVWSSGNNELTAVYKNWFIHEKQGFWKPTPHLELVNKQFYDTNLVSLKQHLIVEEDTVVSVYNLWAQCYTVESISALLRAHGFEVVSITGDLTGAAYEASSKLIGIIAKKVG
jgi:ubiquinone/menaquinone biosynthesis C-methylase UbiE